MRPEPGEAPRMIEVSQLTKKYGEFTAVSDLGFSVTAGSILGLVGPNGAGKTTTLRCLAGIIPATLGRSRICGSSRWGGRIGMSTQGGVESGVSCVAA